MKRRLILTFASAAALVVMVAGRVDAQPSGKWTDTAYLHVDGGVQAATSGFTSTVTFKLYGEDGTMTAKYTFVTSALVTGRGGFRIGGNLGLGLAASRFSRNGDAVITAQLPHPFYFNQPRSAAGPGAGLKREETLVAAELSWLIRAGQKLDVMLFAGPAYFTTRQDMATRPLFTEAYPYSSATLTGVESRTVSKSAAGFTAGLDLSYLFNRHMGLGSLVRFSRGTETFSPVAGSSTRVTLGGVQASAGVRIRF
jgi:hypothetical protein